MSDRETTRRGKQADPTREAADWLARMRSENADAGDARAHETWLAADAGHRAEFQEYEEIWDLMEDLGQQPDLLERPTVVVLEQGLREKSLWRSLVIGEGGHRLRRLAAAAALFLIAAGALISMEFIGAGDYRTAVGEQKIIELADGSTVHLNTGTSLSVAYTDARRLIHLKHGEALFSVAHDAARPFVVRAGSGYVRALGTTFNLLRAGEKTTVSVIEGTVRVSREPVLEPKDAAGTIMVTQEIRGVDVTEGGRVSYSATEPEGSPERADLHRIQAWGRGVLDFDSQTLAAAVAEMNRYLAVKVVIGDEAVRGYRISGIFNVGDADGFLSAVTMSYPVRIVVRDDAILLLPQA